MAKLQSDHLALEIKFKSFEYEWINYDIIFYWKDDIIVNNSILKREGEWWKKRNYGTFIADDYEEDHLIDTIKEVLKTNKAEYWEPLEPDVTMAIYPNKFFPFLKCHWTLIDNDKEEQIENEIREIREDDLFTIITFIDSYGFKDETSYSGEGISLHMTVRREDLEKFVSDLEIEYNNLSDLPS
jgi:hypothetical protein